MKIIRQFVKKMLNLEGSETRKDPRFSHLGSKQVAEIRFWDEAIWKCIDWYEGRLSEFYTFPSPTEESKEKRFSLRENAIWTWMNVSKTKYLYSLQVDENYFAGRSILDIGCGPHPHLHCFKNTKRYGIDQLIDEYRKLGFPLEKYDPPITYINGGAEDIPVDDNMFDAVISVNALDHVDDLLAAAKEIDRVLKPDGILRIQVHYHKATRTEPVEMNDDIIMKIFSRREMKKINEKPHPREPAEKLVVWSTHHP